MALWTVDESDQKQLTMASSFVFHTSDLPKLDLNVDRGTDFHTYHMILQPPGIKLRTACLTHKRSATELWQLAGIVKHYMDKKNFWKKKKINILFVCWERDCSIAVPLKSVPLLLYLLCIDYSTCSWILKMSSVKKNILLQTKKFVKLKPFSTNIQDSLFTTVWAFVSGFLWQFPGVFFTP